MGVRLADLTNVPLTMAEAAAQRLGKTIEKGKTRLELKVEATPVTTITERDFKKEVWHRDQKHCRCCGRRVIKSIERVPNRGEVNHIHGRTGDLRFEVRAAILMCLQCHERFTGRVNKHRLQIIASKTFTIRQGTFTDATFPVTFTEAA